MAFRRSIPARSRHYRDTRVFIGVLIEKVVNPLRTPRVDVVFDGEET